MDYQKVVKLVSRDTPRTVMEHVGGVKIMETFFRTAQSRLAVTKSPAEMFKNTSLTLTCRPALKIRQSPRPITEKMTPLLTETCNHMALPGSERAEVLHTRSKIHRPLLPLPQPHLPLGYPPWPRAFVHNVCVLSSILPRAPASTHHVRRRRIIDFFSLATPAVSNSTLTHLIPKKTSAGPGWLKSLAATAGLL